MSPADRPALVKRPPMHPADAETETVTAPPVPADPAPPLPADRAPVRATEPAATAGDVLLAVRVPAHLRRWYKQAALDHDRSMRELIIAALEAYQSELASKLANKPNS